MNRDVVVLLSGGVDSTVLAARALQLGRLAAAVFVDYGQPAARQEFDAAERWCRPREIPLHARTVLGTRPSPLTIGAGEPGPRVVPGRNLMLLAMAVDVAVEVPGAREIWYGATRDDRAAYADCRPGFVDAINHALIEGEVDLEVDAPFIPRDRSEVVALGRELGVDLAATWSCYQPARDESPCGTCDACRRRT